MQDTDSTSCFEIDSNSPSRTEDFSDIQMIPSAGFCLLATAVRDGKRWMLKGLKTEYADTPIYQDALIKEYDILCKLQHPNIVSVEDFTWVEGLGNCIVMEYVNGTTLSEAIACNPSLRDKQKMVCEILDAVEYFHKKQVVHRDIKPSNIMIVGGSYVKIIDFGLSDSEIYTYLKQPSGTEKYMSPEQKEFSVPDFRNDIYSIGCVLENMNLGKKYNKVISRCKKSIDERYQSIDELREDFISVGKRVPMLWFAASLLLLVSLTVLGVRYHWMDDVYSAAKSVHLTDYDFEENGICYNVLSRDSAFVEVTHRGKEASYDGDITIPETVNHNGKVYTVVRIGDEAFRNCDELVAVVLPQSIRSLGNSIFLDSDLLATLNLPDGIEEMGDSVMRNCNRLRSVHFPRSMKEVPPYCFSGCGSLHTIGLHEGIVSLKRDAFGGALLDSIAFPSTLTTIERGVFWDCKRLKKIHIPSSVTRIGDFVFWGCDSITDVYVERSEPLPITNIFQNLKDVKLHVPSGSVDAYRKAEGWKMLDVTD